MKLLKPGAAVLLLFFLWLFCSPKSEPGLTLAWQDNILAIRGDRLPGGELTVWYLEAFCRAGSHDRDWNETVIGHATALHYFKRIIFPD